jgi:hypothetical protein
MTNKKWLRQKGERSKAFKLFCIYRDLGPTRSLDQVHQKFNADSKNSISHRQIASYSTQNDWVERAEAYDDFVDEMQVEKNLQAIVEMNRRQAEDAVQIQKQALDDFNNAEEDLRSMASLESRKNAAVRTWKVGVDTERLARGMATEKVEQSGTVKQRHSGRVEVEHSNLSDPDWITSKREAMDGYYKRKKEKEAKEN